MKKLITLTIISLALILPVKAYGIVHDRYIMVNGNMININWVSTITKRDDKQILFLIGGGTGSEGRAIVKSHFPDRATRDRIYNSLINVLHPIIIK